MNIQQLLGISDMACVSKNNLPDSMNILYLKHIIIDFMCVISDEKQYDKTCNIRWCNIEHDQIF